MKSPPQIIALKGYSNSGKTSSLESIVKFLKREGKKTAIIKNIHQENFSIDQPGKDTWKMRHAGGDPIVSYSKDEIAFLTNKKLDVNQTIQLLQKIREDLDYIFLEGFWKNKYPKILFFKDLDELERIILHVFDHPLRKEILLSTFCLSGLYSLKCNKHDLLEKFATLCKQKPIDMELKIHLETLPMINIKKEPDKLLKLYNSSTLVYENL